MQGESKNEMNTTLTILLLSLLPIAGFALLVFGGGNPAHKDHHEGGTGYWGGTQWNS